MREKGNFDVVILGAGLGGLTAGAILAAEGARVLLLERERVVGGRARVMAHGAFALPTGPHSFPRETVDAALARAGASAPLYPRPGKYRLYNLARRRLYSLLEAGAAWEETVEKFGLSPEDARQVRSLIEHIDPETWQGKSASAWVETMKLPARTARLCANSALWATDGALTLEVIAMDLFPMAVFALFAGELGWMEYSSDQRLPEALRERVEARGEVECGAEVVSIEREGEGCEGVLYRNLTTDSLWRVRAPVVVSNIPIVELAAAGILPSPLPSPLAARLRALAGMAPYLGGLITVWYGLRRPVVPGGDSIGFFAEDPETGTHTLARGYFRAYSTTVPTLAPPGAQLLHIDGYILPHERGNWKQIAAKGRQLDWLARRYVEAQGWGSLDEELEFSETTVSHHLWGAYNWSCFRPYLPDVSCTEIPGLYFAGNMVQSTPGLFGVAGAIDSGVRAADAVLAGRVTSRSAPASGS